MISKREFTGDNGLRLVVDPLTVVAVAEVGPVTGSARIGRAQRNSGCIIYLGNESFWVGETFEEVTRALGVFAPGANTMMLP